MLKLGVLVSGRGSNFQAVIDAIEAGKVKATVALLVSDKPQAYALERARKHRIPCIYIDPNDFNSKDDFFIAITDKLKAAGVELVMLAGFMRIVRKPLLDAYPMKVMNIHPALLPSFPGLHGQRQAVQYGVRISGCTVHFIDEGMDTGPIIIQAAVPVLNGDTEESLSERILRYEHRIYPEAIRLYAEGRIQVTGKKVRVLEDPSGGSAQGLAIINPPL